MMTDPAFGFKHSKQSNKEKFYGTLALRVFLSALIFLVFPMLFYSFMMYRYQVAIKQSQVSQMLNLVSERQNIMFEQFIQNQLKTLELLGMLIEKGPQERLSKELSKISEFEHIKQIFVLELDNGQIKELALSGTNGSRPFYKELFFEKGLLIDDYRVNVIYGKDTNLYLTKVLERQKGGQVLKTLNICIPTVDLLAYLTQSEGYIENYQVSFYRQSDHVIFNSQLNALLGKEFIVTTASEGRSGIFEVKILPEEEVTYKSLDKQFNVYATQVSLAEVDFNILITTHPYKASFYLQEFFYLTVLLLISILVFGSIAAFFTTSLLAKPLEHLCDVMEKVGNKGVSARYHNSTFGFEINKVGQIFNRTVDNLIAYLHRLEIEHLKRAQLQQELDIGQQIQKSLVPKSLPHVAGIEIQAGLIPAADVGGDFYDFFVHPKHQDEVVITIADTSGHGVFGCFYSLAMRSILKTLAETTTSLKEILLKANKLFIKDAEDSHVFVTVWMGIYNQQTKKLAYCSCGHPFGFLFRKGALFKELATPGIALGATEDLNPIIDSVDVEAEDLLIFITDGVTETMDPKGQLFGKEGFIEVVEKNAHLETDELFTVIIKELETFEVDPKKQHDDITMVIMKIKAT